MKPIDTLCGQTAEFFNFKTDATSWSHTEFDICKREAPDLKETQF
jgi:hypothetical protein